MCESALTLFEDVKNFLPYTTINCQLNSSLYMREWVCEFGRSISLCESSRREATECLLCSIVREFDDKCDAGTPLPCQMTCKFRCTLWIVMLLASVWLIEHLKQLSAFKVWLWLIAAGFCYIRKILSAQKKKVHKIICLSIFQSFSSIREVAESADSFVMSVRLSFHQHGKLERLSPNLLLAVIIKIFRKKFNCGYNCTVLSNSSQDAPSTVSYLPEFVEK
jgi:hypothetical protein